MIVSWFNFNFTVTVSLRLSQLLSLVFKSFLESSKFTLSKTSFIVFIRGNVIQIFIETMKLIIIALLLLSYLTVLSEGSDPDDEYDYDYEKPTPSVIKKKDPCKVTSKNIG